jgi:hypothetical protein
MRSSTRRSRKMGPAGLVEKRPLYVQLMKQGYSNSEACPVLGIGRNTGHRWLHGRNGVEGLIQQGLDPRPRWLVQRPVGPLVTCQKINASSLQTVYWRVQAFDPSPGISGGPHPRSAGSWPETVLTPAAIIRSVPRKWRRRDDRDRGFPSLPVTPTCGSSLWNACRSDGVRNKSAERCRNGFQANATDIWSTKRSTARITA